MIGQWISTQQLRSLARKVNYDSINKKRIIRSIKKKPCVDRLNEKQQKYFMYGNLRNNVKLSRTCTGAKPLPDVYGLAPTIVR